ncbi:MAG TPA: carboxypeptidase regulatory-like domain-containing protein [Candidatus Dormibacteraeota bacterium]|nr:carboxypeptidase regulatory-like domain-containing protein [Candidatus Dormibacteraeota bacterium]
MRNWKALPILLGLVGMVSTAIGQVSTGAILGAVTDQSGAVVADAEVTVKDAATGNQRTVKTGVDGGYIVENLKPGAYEIVAAKVGFKEKRITGIVLQVSQRARIDIAMDLGSVTEHVEVTGATPTLETETSSVGKVITTQDVVNLPLNGRQFLQLATLIPGVHKTYTPIYMENTGGSVSENGMSVFSNNSMIDGVMNQEIGAGRMNFSPSIDMIQEFKMQTNTYDAEYGRTGGSQIEVVTKRGGNTYHGSLYEFLRNNALDARPYFQRGPLPAFRRNQFGGTFGGHIPHLKKDFFFSSYEGLRLSQGLTAVLSLPPAALRRGDFSSTGTTIYDPLTLNRTTGQRQPFPGNVIPAGRLNSVDLYFLNKFLPNPASGSGVANNFVSNPVLTQNINQISFRYDRDFSDKDSVTFRYTRNKFTAILPLGDGGNSTPVPGLGENLTLWGLNHLVRWTHLFGSATMNTLSLGFSQYHQDRFNETTGKGFIAASGMQGVTGGLDAGIPQFNIAGFSSLTDNARSPVNQPFNNYALTDSFGRVWGKHSIRLGGGLIYNRAQTHFDQNDRGALNFAPTYTTASIGASGNQYNSFAEFLLGTPVSASIFLQPLKTDWRSRTESAFVQDDWRVTQSLSVNLGLRYDIYTRPFEEHNKMAAFDLVTQKEIYPGAVPNIPGVPPGSLVAESLGYGRSLQFPTTYNNFSPRVGFAWRLFGSQKTVLRGGAGVFYHWLVVNSATALSTAPPWVPTLAVSCNNDIPCVSSTSPYSSVVTPTPTANVANKTNRTPYVVQFSLGVQHALTPSLSLEVNYVGNAAFKNLLTLNINQPAPGPGAVASRRPYPAFGTLNNIYTIGRSHYDSLQTAVRKTYDRTGLVLLVSYTYSHALGDSVSGPQISETPPGGIRYFKNYQAEYGNTVNDVRHVLSVSGIYQLPFGKGRPLASNLGGVANAIIGGWTVEGIASYRTGDYLTPIDIVDVSNSGNSRPDVIGRPNGFSHSDTGSKVAKWFNTAAFQRAPRFTFGNSGAGIIEGPGYNAFDLALQKRFLIRESMGLQVRGEFFNAFNHTNLGNPSTSFGSAGFGTISSIVGTARDIQLGLRLDF